MAALEAEADRKEMFFPMFATEARGRKREGNKGDKDSIQFEISREREEMNLHFFGFASKLMFTLLLVLVWFEK